MENTQTEMSSHHSSSVEDTLSQSTHQTSRSSSPNSSLLSSTKSNKKTNKKLVHSKEVRVEDEMFFKDDLDPSRAPQDGCMDPISGEQTAQDLELTVRRRKIIQDILRLFNLEEVMDRYRGDSVNMSFNKRYCKQWLTHSMSEDISTHSDRQWNDQFRQKVLEEFERKQDIRERKLADAECQRMLKLKLQGIIRDEEEERTAELAMRKTASEKRFDRRIAKNHQSLFKPNDIETQMEVLNRDESGTHRKDTSRNGDCNSSDGIHGDEEDLANDGRTSTAPTYKSQLGRTNEDTKDVHPQLKDFYEEEDLGQLYREAESLVRRTTRNK